jgi:hypothetical protein
MRDYGALVGRHAIPSSPGIGVRHVVAAGKAPRSPKRFPAWGSCDRAAWVALRADAKPVDASSIAATIAARFYLTY